MPDMNGVELYRKHGLGGHINEFDIDSLYIKAAESREPEVLSVWQKPKETGSGTDTILAITPLARVPTRLKELYDLYGTPLYVVAVDWEEFPPAIYT